MSALPARASSNWSLVFRVSYRFIRLVDPLIRPLVANRMPGLGRIVEVRTVGRRSGRPRTVLVTMLTVDGNSYLGHPNGSAPWTKNIQAAGWVDVDPPAPVGSRCTAVALPAGPERDAAIRATWRQQQFPANLLYRAAARHVAAVGVYFRLEEAPAATTDGA
jgi:hypothetical protein